MTTERLIRTAFVTGLFLFAAAPSALAGPYADALASAWSARRQRRRRRHSSGGCLALCRCTQMFKPVLP